MTKFLSFKKLGFFICLQAALLSLLFADTIGRKTDSPIATAKIESTNRFKPSPDEGRIAQAVVYILEKAHYSQKRMDDLTSSNFLYRLLNDIDSQHLHFLQSDVAEFEVYQDKLDNLLVKGDVSPGREIFSRFLQRLEQHTDYVDELLKTEKFEFNGKERILVNRKDAPFPKNLADAKKIWRERLRAEYLEEKLNKTHPAKPAASPHGSNVSTNKADAKASEKPKSAKEIHEEIVKLLEKRYARTLKMFKDYDSDDVLEYYLTTLAHAFDPHSDYFGKSQLEGFSIQMNLSLFGIGAQLKSDDGYCIIDRLVAGPAMKSKQVKPGDKIVAVAQGEQTPVDVVDMPLPKVVSLIRGKKGTEVRLTIMPVDSPSNRKIVSLVRDEIPLEDSAAKGKIIELPSGKNESYRIGVIDLPSFYSPMDFGGDKSKEPHYASIDVAKLLKKFMEEKVSGVILDLRRNGGGSLEEAIKLTGLFIKKGPVVQVKNSDGSILVEEDRDPTVLYEGPLVVLTGRFSASASEIVAGALQDHGRALLVGEASTHGKGTVQSLNDLKMVLRETATTNSPGAVKVTIRKFYRPSGSSTQLRGVVPDIVLPSKWNVWEGIGEAAVPGALPWDTIDSARFVHTDRVEPYLEQLQTRSESRVKREKEFDYVREDIAEYLKDQKDKTISLNEAERVREREEADAKEKARDKERRERKQPERVVYDIKLKNTQEAGLPAPTTKTNAATASTSSGATQTANISPSESQPTQTDTTNSTEQAKTSTESASAEEKPTVDAELEETESILIDYLSLLPKETILTINQSHPEGSPGSPDGNASVTGKP